MWISKRLKKSWSDDDGSQISHILVYCLVVCCPEHNQKKTWTSLDMHRKKIKIRKDYWGIDSLKREIDWLNRHRDPYRTVMTFYCLIYFVMVVEWEFTCVYVDYIHNIRSLCRWVKRLLLHIVLIVYDRERLLVMILFIVVLLVMTIVWDSESIHSKFRVLHMD